MPSMRPPGGLLIVLPLLVGASAPSHRTPNFLVAAPTPEVARRVALVAERCRREQAQLWLGRDLPAWSRPCPIVVKLTGGEPGGLSSFAFRRGTVADRDVSVEGRLDRILASSIPHEVAHTIFADALGGPMPRWADEGAALLAEDRRERDRYEAIVADRLARGRALALNQLFRREEYPDDIHGFYAQGYSVARFLVETGGRPRFLNFVRDGMRFGWDRAVRAHYDFGDVRDLDRAWRVWHGSASVRVAARRPTTR